MGKLKGAKSILSEIQAIVKEYNAAEKAGDIEAALEKNEQLKEAIRTGVNSPKMPRAKPLSKLEIEAHAERMAPQVAGELTRKDKSAQTIAGKTQQQFKREKTLPVNLEVMAGKTDPRLELPYMTLEDQKGGVLMGLPGDPTLARMNLKGIGDVEFERPVGLHGGPRYGDDEKLWASNLSAASNFLNASQRASQQYGGAPVYASFMKMPSGFGFAQHYLESLLQYQRPDLLPKDMLEKLNEEIRKGYIKDKKKVTFPDFAGFENPEMLQEQTLKDSNLRKHIASRLEASKKSYGLRPAEDVQFAVSHPELTNLETGAGGFTIGKVDHLDPLTESTHPTYSHDIAGKSLGQTKYATPYDLLYRDQLQLIQENPRSPEFNTLKLLGARQKIDDQLINELNEYQERMRLLVGKKDGGEVHMGKGGLLSKGSKLLEEALTKIPKGSAEAQARIEREFAEEAARKAALYKVDKPSGEVGNKALDEARRILSNDDITKAHGGVVHMAEGGKPRKYVPPSQLIPIASQEFPLQKPANVTEADMTPTELHPLAGSLSRGVANVHEFVSKPFGYENPPMEMVSELIGLPAISKTLENYAYGTPNTKGSGQATRLNEEAVDAAMSLPFGAGQTIKAGVKGAVKGAKELAPTAGKLAQEFAEKTQFGMPLELNVVPPSQAVGKAAEVKAPANDLGLYSVVEKAALNLQRKSGNGDAFLSDLMKNQGVSQARLDETGLTAALKGRKGVTREEVQQLAAEGKIPLEERVAKEFTEEPKSFQEHRDNVDRLNNKLTFYGRSIDNLNEDLNKSIQMYGENNVTASQLRDKIKVMEGAYQQTYDELNKLNRVDLEASAAKYGPKESPNLNTKGGENYREILIKTPEKVAKPIDISGWKVVTEDENKYSGQRVIRIFDGEGNFVSERSGYRGSDHDAINNAAKQREKLETSEMNFGGSHHSDPNVLMHLRVADHVDSEGKRGLLIDELQSDWHQKGRDKGYGKKLVDMPKMSADELYDKHFDELTPAQKEYLEGFMEKWESASNFGKDKELDKLTNQYQNWTNKQTIGSGIPDAPFKEDWYQLGLKRAIKEAADSGMDRVYLTTGKTQADRYDLSKHVNDLGYKPDGKGSGRLQAFDKNRITVLDENIPEEKLADYIGKDAAKKLLESEKVMGTHSLSNADLQVGGEGMRQYYDKTYLNYLKKYAKQHGAEVGMTTLPSARKSRVDLSGKEMHELMDNPEFKKILDEEFANDNNPNEKYAWNAALKRFGGQKVYYLDLNPALKNSAKKGQAFADGGAVQSPNDFDYESHVNNIMNAHNASNFDYEGHVKKIMGMAEGGAAYNTQPDMSDGGLSIPAPAFKIGGRIPLLTR